jgi:hypothetical protein
MKSIDRAVKCIKSKFVSDRVQELAVAFGDFFPCEPSFNIFGVSWLNSDAHELSKWLRIHFYASQCVILLMMLLMTLNLVTKYIYGANFVEVVELAGQISIYMHLCIMVYLSMYRNRLAIQSVVDRLQRRFPHSAQEQQKCGIRSHWKRFRVMTMIHSTFVHACWVHFALLPVIMIYRGLYDFKLIEVTLMSPIYFPEELYHTWLYEIVYALQAWSLGIAVIVTFANDSLFWGLLAITELELNIASEKVSEIDPEDDGRAFQELIDQHNELIEVANDIEGIFSPVLLFNIVAAPCGLCCSGFLVFVSEKLQNLLTRIGNLSTPFTGGRGLVLFDQIYCHFSKHFISNLQSLFLREPHDQVRVKTELFRIKIDLNFPTHATARLNASAREPTAAGGMTETWLSRSQSC